MTKSKQSFKILIADIFIFFVGNVLGKGIQFLLMPLYTSFLSAKAYGTAELINNLSELFLPIITLCIYESVLRYTIENQKEKKIIISSAIKIVAISMILFLPIVLLAKVFFNFEYAIDFLLVLYLYSFQRILGCYVRGKDFTKVYAFNGAVSALFLALFSCLFLIILKMDVTGYLRAIWMSYLISVIYLFFAGKVYQDISYKVVDTDVIRILIKYGAPLIPYNVLYFFATLSGRYILLWYFDETMVGMYAAVIKITAIVNLIQQTVTMAMQLNVSKEYKNKDRENYYSVVFNLFTLLFFIFGSGIICVSPILSKITLQKEFYDARIYLPVLIFAAILNCLSGMYGTLYHAYKQTKRTVPSIGIGVLVNLIVCFMVIPPYGIWGVALANLLMYFSQVIYKVIDIKKFCNIKFNGKKFFLFGMICFIQVVLMTYGNVICNIISGILLVIMLISFSLSYKKQIIQIIQRRN